MENNLKFTKCECCPYYAKIDKEWECSRKRCGAKCIFDYAKPYLELGCEVVKNWLNANNGFEVKNEIKA